MTRVGFCGLGLMGAPMALRLVAAGAEVRVWNRSPARCAPLAAAGAAVAATPAEAAAGSDLVVTMLSDAAATAAVVAGPGGLAEAAPPVLAQMATVSPAELAGLAAALPAATRLLDAPVLGSVPQAEAGTLRILAGGEPGLVAACAEALAPLGELVPVGPAGTASALKLVCNAAVAPMVALLAEALALGARLGLDQELVLGELARTRIGPLVERKRAMIAAGDYPADSTLRLFAKDMELVAGAGGDAGLELTMAAAAGSLAAAAVGAGLGDQDYAVLVRYLRGR